VGILVGAFAAFLILKSREQPAPAAAVQQPQSMDMSVEMPRLYAEIHRLRIENDELRLKLQIAAPKGPVVVESKPHPAALHSQFLETPNNNSDRINRMDRINSATNPINPVHPVRTVPAQVQTYKNTEKWKYEKDKLGRITGLEISREAKRNV